MDIRQYESQYENRKEEKHHADSRFPYNIYLCSIPQDFRVVPIHWHEEMELISVKKGSGQVILDLQPFPVKTGDLVIVFPGKLHGIRQKAGCAMEYENIIFRLDMLIPALPDRCSSEFLMPLLSGNGPSSYVCSQGCREFLPVQQLIARLDAISDSRPAGYELAVKGIFFELLFQILPQRQGSGDETAGSRFQGKMKLVLKEVENRYAEPLTVKEMADMCGYSASHFMKFFRRQMGMSFVEYLNDYRLLMAARMLASTEETVTEIARLSGFDQPSYFNRLFRRKYGMTPSEYRKEGEGFLVGEEKELYNDDTGGKAPFDSGTIILYDTGGYVYEKLRNAAAGGQPAFTLRYRRIFKGGL